MQPKSVKPPTPALFQMLISLWLLSPRSQDTWVFVCSFFFLFLSLCFLLILCWMFTWILSSFSLPLPHCLGLVSAYLQLSVVSPSISIFLPLVCPFLSSLSPSVRVLLWQASKQTAYNTEAHQAASAAVRYTHPSHPNCCTTEAPLFHLWTETKSGNPSRSTLSPVCFIIYFKFLNNTCSCIQSCAGCKHAETLR